LPQDTDPEYPKTIADLPQGLAQHPRYRVIEIVETGGMGTVFRAEHQLLKRPVALKVVNPNLLKDERMKERFFQEMRAVAQLDHPNIVTAYDADQIGGIYFLVMEFVEGITLGQVMATQGRLPTVQACNYVRQAAFGLQHAHEHGIVHRDIKPLNLMLTPVGQIKILDFGLARYDDRLTAADIDFLEPAPSSDEPGSGSTTEAPPLDPIVAMKTQKIRQRLTCRGMGTPDFIAPELALDASGADIRADIYSLGCTLYCLLTGQVPFPAGTMIEKLKCHFSRTPALLGQLRPDIPARLIGVVERMMAKHPRARFQEPIEVARALDPFATPTGGHVLVVEDDPDSQAALALALEDQACRVSRAANGLEALEVLRAGPLPDLILLDLVMPVMDGLAFLKEQRQDPALAKIPVIVVSAFGKSVGKAAALGIADHLRKPIEPNQLTGKIEPFLHKREPSGHKSG
jgi:serine/threonine protein kinase